MRKLLLVLTLISMVAFAGTVYAQEGSLSGENKDGVNRAMWVWDFDSSVSTEQNRNDLIHFSKQHHINLLVVYTGSLVTTYPEPFEALIRAAHKNKIRVYGLDGDADWALESNHSFALQAVQNVLDFNKTHPKTKFDGFQHDIEPFGMPDFFDNVQSYGSQFLDVLKQCEELVHTDKGMIFEVAIPFWYATAEPSPISLTYDGLEKPLDHHILDIVDSVAIMSYRDSAAAQIEVSQHDVDYAASVGKKAYVGAETTTPEGTGLPPFITYYDEGLKYMEDQFKLIDKYYKDHPGYAGIAVEWYNTYRTMPK
ncbi:hypothetical protein [Cohnella sp. REN36]|uniref:hypothetical protein n=1 Tax=Cohnella sp. REN36 TaxID=2887347 RepID=UPI001D14E6B7|nr:hypothetical protein [Cohnella sp. REN36]MCC3375449.1 hypothetical protein [Cohnella sp. REN36]